jgi:hypothetical protein
MNPSGWIRVAVLGTCCALAVAGCGGSSSNDKKTTSTTSSTTKSVPPKPVPPPPVLAKVGTPQDVTASHGGKPKTTLKVTVTGYVPKLTPRFLQVGKLRGARYVGVRLLLVNVGDAAWSGSPGRAGTLVTGRDTQAPKVPAVGTCGGPFASKVELIRGERQRGCLAFILAAGERPGHFQFSPDSPTSPPVEWALP